MQLNISGHHLDITPALKQHTNQKLSKIRHHFDQVMNVNMILEVQKDVQTDEATIHLRSKNAIKHLRPPSRYHSSSQATYKRKTLKN